MLFSIFYKWLSYKNIKNLSFLHTLCCKSDDTSIFLFPMYYCSIFHCPLFLFPIFRKEKLVYRSCLLFFLPNIPIPDIYTTFRNNDHNFTKKCSLFLQKNVCRYIDQFLIKQCSLFLFVVISSNIWLKIDRYSNKQVFVVISNI